VHDTASISEWDVPSPSTPRSATRPLSFDARRLSRCEGAPFGVGRAIYYRALLRKLGATALLTVANRITTPMSRYRSRDLPYHDTSHGAGHAAGLYDGVGGGGALDLVELVHLKRRGGGSGVEWWGGGGIRKGGRSRCTACA
jgi:hypothetical protein